MTDRGDLNDAWPALIHSELRRLDVLAKSAKFFGLEGLVVQVQQRLYTSMAAYQASQDRARRYALKAEECRTIAGNFCTPEARLNYETMARSYDQMAEHATKFPDSP
jgi:hypothetical protein